MPAYVWQALVSAEDRAFFHHPGIDAKGLARAIIFLGGRGGGSTLTQQLIKNLFLSDSKTISRSGIFHGNQSCACTINTAIRLALAHKCYLSVTSSDSVLQDMLP